MQHQAKWTGWFKVVDPTPQLTKMVDNMSMDSSSYTNYSWYQKVISGSSTRIARYNEYDAMDSDVDVARALDLVAEEMTNRNLETSLPLNLNLNTDFTTKIPQNIVTTLRVCLKHWCMQRGFQFRMHGIARHLIKYGDMFFERIINEETKAETWEYINAKNVVGAIVDQNSVTNILGWQVRKDTRVPRENMGGVTAVSQAYETEVIPSADIIRFSLNDDLSDEAPFGISVLNKVYRVTKQKELLEDSIVIYRVQRAPERRVFYIDVGKMPPQRTKQYLENIKNEIKQKKVPSVHGGNSNVDSVYNPQSMCLALDTIIPLLDGRELTLQQMIDEHNSGKQNWVYSVNPSNGKMAPGIVSWAGITQSMAETIVLTLDNGDTITCTPEHKFPVQGRGFVQAKDLTTTDSLFPFNMKHEGMHYRNGTVSKQPYTYVYDTESKKWKTSHRMVANFMKSKNMHNENVYDSNYSEFSKNTIHHINFNAIDNNPSNLTFMSGCDHCKYHREFNPNQTAVFTPKLVEIFEERANRDIHITFKNLMHLLNNDIEFMTEYARTNQSKPGFKNKLDTTQFRQKMFLVFIKTIGFKNWKYYQNHQIAKKLNAITNINDVVTNKSDNIIKMVKFVLDLCIKVSPRNFVLVQYLKDNKDDWDTFTKLYHSVSYNSGLRLTVPDASMFDRVAKLAGYSSFKQMITESTLFNHKVVSIHIGPTQPVGTLTIDSEHKYHDYHTFALKSCFTKNSEDFYFATRPGANNSRVETLPGGQNLGELTDLEYFRQQLLQGLRIPPSYLPNFQSPENVSFNDGQVGVAYMAEIQFFKYVTRLQNHLNCVFDQEFKKYLRKIDINIDPSLFEISVPLPTNFEKYREAAMDGVLLSQFGNADGVQYLSKRFVLSRYLKLSSAEMSLNEALLAQERGLNDKESRSIISLYNPDLMNPDSNNEDMSGGGMGGGMPMSPDNGGMPPVEDNGDSGGLQNPDLQGNAQEQPQGQNEPADNELKKEPK